jgi:hypothetical protein
MINTVMVHQEHVTVNAFPKPNTGKTAEKGARLKLIRN